MPRKSFALVAAIDIGTTFSGYAFSTKKDSREIVTGAWKCDSIVSAKTLTCILLNEDKSFKAFGYDAEDAYAELVNENNHKRYFFFRRFKTTLFTEQLHSNFPLEDEIGNKLPAIDVYSACVRHLRERVMQHSREQVSDIDCTDIKWVLTVPVNCSDTFKTFVKEAAKKAGFDSDELLIANEPEAASTYCRYFIEPPKKGDKKDFIIYTLPSKCLVLDAGGGTIDITLRHVESNGSIKELYAANDCAWAGSYIYKAFRDLLSDIVGSDVIDHFQATNVNDYNILFRKFEAQKRRKNLSEINVILPPSLVNAFQKNLKKSFFSKTPKYSGLVTMTGDELRICAEIVGNLFTKPFEKISNHLESLFTKDIANDVSTILLVGGFSESEMLQGLLRDRFPNKKLIIPVEPGLAVLKGAVIFGHEHIAMTAYMIVAAIDFGTTYSGYAFSTITDFKMDPLKAVVSCWNGDTLLSLKTPTCVLFDEDKTFRAFGFDAENTYVELAIENNHTRLFFFRRFKMKLFNKTHLQRNFLLEDEMGNRMPAIDVFSACFRYLREHVMEHSRKQFHNIVETDFRWVLTLPAIWNDTSKQFMREAAEKAGFESDQLLIALEPEAASLCCRHLPLTKIKGCVSGFVPFTPKSKYLVLDAGGGTIDITIHQIQDDGSIKELYAANGGDWGGTYIDKAFRDLLSEIVGPELMDEFQKTHMDDYIDLFREFEVKKRKITNDMSGKITFKVPSVLDILFVNKHKIHIKDHIATKPQYSGHVIWLTDKLRIGADIAKKMYTEAFEKISHHLEYLFADDIVKDVSTILFVGGFSESEMLQGLLRDRFPNKTLIIPADAGLAVLKGAVVFGHDPQVIKERRCRFTYGVDRSPLFDETIHPVSKRFLTNTGIARCKDVFSKHVELGQPVVVGESQVERKYKPVHVDQATMKVNVYTSSEKDPSYVDEPSCKLLGSLTVALDGTGLDRSVSVQMTFSETELNVTATNTKTGNKVYAKFDFLD